MSASANNVQFVFSSVEVLAKNLTALTGPPLSPDTRFYFEVTAENKVLADSHIVFCITDITVKNGQSGSVYATVKTACSFTVENFDQHIILDTTTGLYLMPLAFEDIIRQLSITTSRGILFGELKGTYLSGVTMPVISFPSVAGAGTILT